MYIWFLGLLNLTPSAVYARRELSQDIITDRAEKIRPNTSVVKYANFIARVFAAKAIHRHFAEQPPSVRRPQLALAPVAQQSVAVA